MSSGGRLAGALVVLAVVLFGAIRSPLLSIPLERDEGEYAYIAQRMLEGGIPYLDAFDQKPPGVFVAYAAAFTLMGESTSAIRGFASLWALLTLLCVAGLARTVAGPVAGGAAALLFAISISTPSVFGFTGNTELFAILPATASVWLTVRALQRPGAGAAAWALASALATLAFVFKQVAAVQWLLVAGAAAWHVANLSSENRFRAGLGIATGLAAGGLTVLVPIALAFAVTDAFGPMIDAVFLHNFEYAGVVDWQKGLSNLADALSEQAPTFAVPWALALITVSFPGIVAPRVRKLLAAWFAVSFVAVSLGLNYRLHYFVMWLPVLAVLGGAALAEGWETLRQRRPRIVVSVLATAMTLLLAPPLLDARAVLAADSNAAQSHILYGRNPFADSPAIARHIRANSGPDDTVFIMGSEPQILFYADRVSASRYIFTYPLMGAFRSAALRQRETVDSVEAGKPLFLVWVRIPTSHLAAPRHHWLLPKAVSRWISTDYTLDAIWVPREEDFGFEAHVGEDAIAWTEANPKALGSELSIQVFRRRSAEGENAPTDQAASDGGIPTM